MRSESPLPRHTAPVLSLLAFFAAALPGFDARPTAAAQRISPCGFSAAAPSLGRPVCSARPGAGRSSSSSLQTRTFNLSLDRDYKYLLGKFGLAAQRPSFSPLRVRLRLTAV